MIINGGWGDAIWYTICLSSRKILAWFYLTNASDNLWGISINGSQLQELEKSSNPRSQVPVVLLLNKFRTFEIISDSNCLDDVQRYFSRPTEHNLAVHNLYISLTEKAWRKLPFNFTKELWNFQQKNLVSINGIHFPADISLSKVEIDKFEKLAARLKEKRFTPGILVTSCDHTEPSNTTIKLLKVADYVVCDFTTIIRTVVVYESNYSFIKELIDSVRGFRWRLSANHNLNMTVFLRIGWPKNYEMSEKEISVDFVKFVQLVHDFCKVTTFRFFYMKRMKLLSLLLLDGGA